MRFSQNEKNGLKSFWNTGSKMRPESAKNFRTPASTQYLLVFVKKEYCAATAHGHVVSTTQKMLIQSENEYDILSKTKAFVCLFAGTENVGYIKKSSTLLFRFDFITT